MIIPEDTPASPLKSNYNGLPQEQQQEVAPPSYGAIQSQPFVFPASTQRYFPPGASGSASGSASGAQPSCRHQPPQAYAPAPPEPRRSPAKRFCKAFCVAILIWVLFSLLLGSLRLVIHSSGNGRRKKTWYDDIEVPSELSLRECTRGADMLLEEHLLWKKFPSASETFPNQQNYPYPSIPEIPEIEIPDISYSKYVALASYDLPLSSPTLYLLARGAQHSGKLTVVADSGNVARVEVKVLVYHLDMLENIETCLVERPDGVVGVGLFSPRSWPSKSYKERAYFDVTLKLPSASESHLQIHAFETDLPNFTHVLGALGDFVEFEKVKVKGSNSNVLAESLKAGNVSIRTSNGAIDIKSLSAEEAEIHTSEGPIFGYYNVSGVLDLRTSDAPIKSDVDLYSSKGKGKLTMSTKNSPIESNINLLQVERSTPEFTVTTTTSNSRLNLNIHSLPSSSPLFLNSKTSNNEAKVYLPATYEGTYSLSTSNAVPMVFVENHVDPEGRQRQRQNRVKRRVKNVLEGEVFWEEGNRQRGSAQVRSSNGRVEVRV